jgi:hypothetical protein
VRKGLSLTDGQDALSPQMVWERCFAALEAEFIKYKKLAEGKNIEDVTSNDAERMALTADILFQLDEPARAGRHGRVAARRR